MDQATKAEIVKEYGTHEGDTGSSQVQIALLTARIQEMTGHMKEHHKDFHSRRGLVAMVNLRRKLQKYMNRTERQKYLVLRDKLGLRA